MKLDVDAMDDARFCKVRADSGLDAIGHLDPGLVTGPLSVVWQVSSFLHLLKQHVPNQYAISLCYTVWK